MLSRRRLLPLLPLLALVFTFSTRAQSAAPAPVPASVPPPKSASASPEESADATAPAPRVLASNRVLQLELQGLIRLLEEVHFNRDKVTRASYAEVIPNALKSLDGQRLFILSTDLDKLQASNRPETLYWNLSTLGRLDPAFAVFSLYEQRVRDRVSWIQARLPGAFDFTTNATYELDRSKKNWPATTAEADALWENRLRFELLQELLNDKSLDEARAKISKRYDRLLKNLDDFQAGDVAEIFLTAITSLYDPHSTYFSPDTFDDFNINMRLQLFGIGALLGIDEDICTIKEIIPGGPAEFSRVLKPNDKILAVAQEKGEFVEIVGMKLRSIVQMIRGEKGTKVRLLIQPGDAADAAVRKEIVLVRDLINLDSARAHAAVFQLPNAQGKLQPYGVITLPTFYGRDDRDAKDQNSATDDIADLIKRLKEQGIQGLVLDLRRNGGGLLGEAVSLTGLFIPSGPVVQIRNYAGKVTIDEDDDPSVAYDGPLVVLTSRFSASASEIVAGALQNYGRAVIIGDTSTHGKGTVQTVIKMDNVIQEIAKTGLPSGASKLTTQKFYLPSGASTQLKGVVPDIIIPSIDEFLPIGEQDLPHALPWDVISPSFYDAKPLPKDELATLRERSTERIATLPEFSLLKRNIARFQERQNEKAVSLNFETRKTGKAEDKVFRDEMTAERKALETQSAYSFTEYFVAPPPPPRIKAEKPIKSDEDSDEYEDDTDDESDNRYKRMDVYLRESLRVVSDLHNFATLPAPAKVAQVAP